MKKPIIGFSWLGLLFAYAAPIVFVFLLLLVASLIGGNFSLEALGNILENMLSMNLLTLWPLHLNEWASPLGALVLAGIGYYIGYRIGRRNER